MMGPRARRLLVPSPSMVITKSPGLEIAAACRSPVSKAAATPRLLSWERSSRGMAPFIWRTMGSVASVLPSSTTMTSRSGRRRSRMEARF